MPTYRIAPSLLSADFARLGEEAEQAIAAGADMLHLDVMDQHFVPSLTVGPLVCSALRRHGIQIPIDVHLMTRPVDSLVSAFAKAGATRIAFHPECSDHIDRSLALIRNSGCSPGLALNPATSLHVLDHLLDRLDFVLIMSVNPGFAGQPFLASSLDKISRAQTLFKTAGRDISIAVDGGIKPDNIASIAQAGADTFIVGSAIFETPDYANAIRDLRHRLGTLSDE